jgi:outer membrane protein insertion porin family
MSTQLFKTLAQVVLFIALVPAVTGADVPTSPVTGAFAEGVLLPADVPDVFRARLSGGVPPHQGESAQRPSGPLPPGAVAMTPCGNPVGEPTALPPAGSPPFVWTLELCFERQGGSPNIDVETYLFYTRIQNSVSSPREGRFIPYTEQVEEVMLNDFKTLMHSTNFLDDMVIKVTDHTFPNGVVGKILTYDMEERERVKIVQYEGTRQIDRTKIDEQLRERGIQIRLDSFVDDGIIRRVKSVLREMMAEKGFTNAVIGHELTPVAGGPKLVNVTFNIDEGPKIRIRSVDFIGNSAMGNRTLQRRLKSNKPRGWLSWITGGGTYKEAEFEEDAARVVEHYHNQGYAQARVGQPDLRVLEDSRDGRTRWVELRIPVTEGPRYRFGELDFDGNKLVSSANLRTLYRIEPGEWYSRKKLQDGNRRAQEIYGSAGYMEFVPFPDLRFSDQVAQAEAALASLVPEALAAPPPTRSAPRNAPPTVDVTLMIEEGPQYFVNRITFTGNTTTRDNVIRREMRLVEGGVFDTEALKYSVRRLNQLGYFKQLEGDDRDMKVDKTPGRDHSVDVTLTFEEQNRNQLTFGAGISQYEGFFGQLGFQTTNFRGRGESLTLSLQGGERAQNYQAAYTQPFLFDRNITAGFDVYKRSLQYIGYYTHRSVGGNLMAGFPVADFSRVFFNYSYEQVRMTDLNEAFLDPTCLTRATGCSIISPSDLSSLSPEALESVRRNPFVFDSLLLGQGGRRTISKVVPTFVHNTVDHPIFPSQGTRYTMALELAGLGGNTSFYKPRFEGIWFKRHTSRTSIGARAQVEYIAPYAGTQALPIFERLFLGGEYSIRGFDIRSIGPSAPETPGLVLGGNKSLLFNAEYLFTIAGPVRLVAFFDAGQVRDIGQSFTWKEDIVELRNPGAPLLVDPFSTSILRDPNAPAPFTEVVGRTHAFKASTGVELRFFMPVLNVPFRLIYAWNPSRTGVLDNSLRPARDRTFRFAVGTTF